MNNLSLILNTYFVDADFDEIIHSFWKLQNSAKIGMDEENFAKRFLKQEKAYGYDVVKNINQFAMDCWITDKNGKKNVFNICAKAAEDMLVYENDEPVCRQQEYLRWNEISRIVGEDLLILSHLAKNISRTKIHSFAWKPFIKSDSITINNILEKGLHELHSHMNGASLNFDINWLGIMNAAEFNSSDLKKVLKAGFSTELMNAEKAIAIRLYLYSKTNGITNIDKKQLFSLLKSNNFLEIQSQLTDFKRSILIQKQNSFKFGNGRIDYAIPKCITSKDTSRYYNVPLIGERKFLYDVLQKIYFPESNDNEYGDLLYAYIVAKNNFRKVIVQYDQIKGFGYFDKIQDRKMLLKEGSIYERLSPYMAVHNVVCNQPIKSMEMRIAPKKESQELLKAVKRYNRNVNEDSFRFFQKSKIQEGVKLGYILHFIKQEDKELNKLKKEDWFNGDLYCRNYKVRKIIDKQARAIETLIKESNPYVIGGYKKKKKTLFKNANQNNNVLCRIVGIDAANSEFFCRPEVFAPVFRRLKHVNRRTQLDFLIEHTDAQLGRTFHAGEDYYDIVDGLRAIDECITFMEFGEGDRIGHGVALGTNAKKYYENRQNRIILPKQTLLDNIVWAYIKIEEFGIEDRSGLKRRLFEQFHELYREIYADVIKNDKKMYQCVSISDYYDSWKLRGDKPKFNSKSRYFKPYEQRVANGLDEIRNTPKLEGLFRAYHFSGQAKIKGNEKTEYRLEEKDFKIIAELQANMRKTIEKKHISIETNPTSNLQITDVEMYCEHPVTVMNDTFLSTNPKSAIDVSINTDDQGVFATSLEKEFTLMALALEKETDADGNPVYKRTDIYQWLNMIRASAEPRSFLA
ncbi:hypothetical protein [Fibrobacter sp. UWB10]|uniref:hypothetical protein n=1 Tax=Fibrobacter sp. UWB10 TaxID=1896201 RepID=UPI00240365B5|nr:hypothetical protein [Fibrobacter sp. UWB10]SMP42735.1 Adenosine/AMP deaminase [Fibrobacter sp. UWB10]